jgi:5-methylcytosine-specific restriction enzyme A
VQSMKNPIPDTISKQDIVNALADLRSGVQHSFGESTGYDVLHEGQRYPPKAVVGLAAARVIGSPLGPYDFKGGLRSKCFRTLIDRGFTIVTKGDTNPFPDEVTGDDAHIEGAAQSVVVNRYERDPAARKKAIQYFGAICQACGFDFLAKYGAVGQGFIHVHHIVPLASIGKSYNVDPEKDLRPVCPNCHAMIHKRTPPYSIEEVADLIGLAAVVMPGAKSR